MWPHKASSSVFPVDHVVLCPPLLEVRKGDYWIRHRLSVRPSVHSLCQQNKKKHPNLSDGVNHHYNIKAGDTRAITLVFICYHFEKLICTLGLPECGGFIKHKNVFLKGNYLVWVVPNFLWPWEGQKVWYVSFFGHTCKMVKINRVHVRDVISVII